MATLLSSSGAPRRRNGKLGRAALRYAIVLTALVFAIFPFLLTLAIALTDETARGSVYNFPASLFSRAVTPHNFADVYRTFSLGKYVWNSVSIPRNHGQNQSLICALSLTGPLAPPTINGPLHGEVFEWSVYAGRTVSDVDSRAGGGPGQPLIASSCVYSDARGGSELYLALSLTSVLDNFDFLSAGPRQISSPT